RPLVAAEAVDLEIADRDVLGRGDLLHDLHQRLVAGRNDLLLDIGGRSVTDVDAAHVAEHSLLHPLVSAVLVRERDAFLERGPPLVRGGSGALVATLPELFHVVFLLARLETRELLLLLLAQEQVDVVLHLTRAATPGAQLPRDAEVSATQHGLPRAHAPRLNL